MKKNIIKFIIIPILILLAMFVYSSAKKVYIKNKMYIYLRNKYKCDMAITDIGYSWSDGSYSVVVKAYNDITFTIHYSKRFGIIEYEPYYVRLWEKEIEDDISVRCSEIFETYTQCSVSNSTYNTDLFGDYYKNDGYFPSINKINNSSISFVLFIGIPENYSINVNDNLNKICEYAFSKYSIKTIYVYKGTIHNKQDDYMILKPENYRELLKSQNHTG